MYIDQITARYPNSLWIAAYPDYEVRPEPYWGVYPNMEHTRWWQFTSTGLAGGLDKNVVIINDGDSLVNKKKEEDIMNFVVRSDSGNQGWVAVVNGVCLVSAQWAQWTPSKRPELNVCNWMMQTLSVSYTVNQTTPNGF